MLYRMGNQFAINKLSEEERIKLAKDEDNKTLLEELLKDESPKVRIALLANKNVFIGSKMFEVLANDKEELVKAEVKRCCEKVKITIEYCFVYYISIKLFGKIPNYTVKEKLAVSSFAYFYSQSIFSFKSFNETLQYLLSTTFHFVENGFYTPYSQKLEYYIRVVNITNKVCDIMQSEENKMRYDKYKDFEEYIDNLFLYLDNLYLFKSYDTVEWLSALGKVYFYLTTMYPNVLIKIIRGDEKEKEKFLKRIHEENELYRKAVDIISMNAHTLGLD